MSDSQPNSQFVLEVQNATVAAGLVIPAKTDTYREGRPPLDRLHDDLHQERMNIIYHDHKVVCDQIGDLLGTLPAWQALWALQEVASAIIGCSAEGDDLEFSATLRMHQKALAEDAYHAHKIVQLEICQMAFARPSFSRAPGEVYRATHSKEGA